MGVMELRRGRPPKPPVERLSETVRIPVRAETLEQLKRESELSGRSMSEIVRPLIENYLRGNENGQTTFRR